MAHTKAQAANTAAQVRVHPAQGGIGGISRPTSLSCRFCGGKRIDADARVARVKNKVKCIFG